MKVLSLALCLISLVATPALSADITVSDVWGRATPGAAKVGAAFMEISNAGEPDKLIGARSEISKTTELHSHIHDEGIMRMREVAAIDIPANGSQSLEPGGYHVMFMGLNRPLMIGEYYPLTLVFEKAGEITVDVKVEKVGALKMKHHELGTHQEMQKLHEKMMGN